MLCARFVPRRSSSRTSRSSSARRSSPSCSTSSTPIPSSPAYTACLRRAQRSRLRGPPDTAAGHPRGGSRISEATPLAATAAPWPETRRRAALRHGSRRDRRSARAATSGTEPYFTEDGQQHLHFGRRPTAKSLERYRAIPPGGNRFDLRRTDPTSPRRAGPTSRPARRT